MLDEGPVHLSLAANQLLTPLVLLFYTPHVRSMLPFLPPEALDFRNDEFERGPDKTLDDPVVRTAFFLCVYGYTCFVAIDHKPFA